MHQPIHEQLAKLEALFDQLHDFLCEEEGFKGEMAMVALKGALHCRALFCDLINENQDEAD